MTARIEVLDLASCELRAMGTDVQVLVVDGDDADLHWAHGEIERLEALWSRFQPGSEVSNINRCAGTWVEVTPETAELVRAAVDAWHTTEGAFDPLLGTQVAALGYDRSFDQVDASGAGATCPPPTPARRYADDLRVDATRACVRLVPGRALDLGGIAKGWTADRIVAGLLQRGAAGACANLGGDVAVGGRAPHAQGWYIGVDHGGAATPWGTIAVPGGGIATSTSRRRRWLGPGGDVRHHLLDPGRGTSVRGAIVDATVVASTATRAEILTKVAFVAPDAVHGLLAPGEALLLTTEGGTTSAHGDVDLLRPLQSA
ncbi:MAG: FAD:protein FMN transferase [Acidimicrobiales bacterium]